MRDPTVKAAAVAEAKRVSDAVDAAGYELFSMIRWARHDKENPAEVTYYSCLNLITRILNDPDADKLIRKHVSPVKIEPDTLVRKYGPIPDAREILSGLRSGRPPLRRKPGGPTKTLRDLKVADIIENIRRRGFDVHRGDATKDKDAANNKRVRQSACSIVANAWRELADGKTPPKRLKEAGTTKALSESSLERIWDESEWAAKARVRKQLTSRR